MSTVLVLAHFIWHIYNRLMFLSINIYYYLLNEFDNTNYIELCQRRPFLRIPEHVAMAFTNESDRLDLDSVAKLLSWCKQLGVKHITLYDDRGKLKSSQKELYKYFEYRMSLLGYEKPISHIGGLNIIDKRDGRQKFVEDIRHLLVKLEPEDIDLNSMQSSVGWSVDPELLISFGSPLCLHGFPPWQLRLTEILSIPTHRNIPQKILADCLDRYSKTTQRLGA